MKPLLLRLATILNQYKFSYSLEGKMALTRHRIESGQERRPMWLIAKGSRVLFFTMTVRGTLCCGVPDSFCGLVVTLDIKRLVRSLMHELFYFGRQITFAALSRWCCVVGQRA